MELCMVLNGWYLGYPRFFVEGDECINLHKMDTNSSNINACQELFRDITRLLNICHRVDLINVTQYDYHHNVKLLGHNACYFEKSCHYCYRICILQT